MRFRSWWRALAGLLISGGLLWWLWQRFDWVLVWQALGEMPPGRLMLATGLFTLALGTRAAAWWVLVQERASWVEVFWSLAVGFLGSTVLPFRLGEAARVVALQRVTGIPWSQAVASVLVARLADAGLLGAVVLVLAPWVLGRPWVYMHPGVWILAGGGGLLLLLLAWWLRYKSGWKRWERLSWVRRGLHWLQHLEGWRSPGLWLVFAWWKVATWTLLALEHWVLLRVWFPQATLVWAYWVVAVASLGVALPSAPGHVGVVQIGILAALWPLGVDPTQALALSLVKHGIYLGVTTVLGLLGLWYVSVRIPDR